MQDIFATVRPKLLTAIAVYHGVLALSAVVAGLTLVAPINSYAIVRAVLWIVPLAYGLMPFPSHSIVWQLAWFPLSFLAACGLWFLRPWGRIVSIVLSIAWILDGIPYFVLRALPQSNPVTFSAAMHQGIKIVFGALIISYLSRASVKLLFHQRDTAA